MARKISVEIVGDASSLQKAFAKSSRSAKGFQGDMERTSRKSRSAFGGIGKMAGLAGGAIGVAGLAGAANAAFTEFSEGQKVMAQTNAVIKSTGKAAHVSAKHVEQLADAMLRKSGIDDEATQEAENWLLSFRNVKNELGKGNKIFDRATAAVADLATAQADGAVPSSEQMVQASKLVGKALDDPIRGLTALRRVGIGFTDQQKDQIKTLVKNGQTMKAQKVILAELNKQVGGRAAAAGKTFAGQWSIVRNTVLNLSATLVAKLMPSIQKLLGQLVKWMNNSKNQKAVLDTVTQAASALKTVVGALSTVFSFLNKITGSTKNTVILLTAAFVAFKALKLIGYIAGVAKAMRGLAAATAAANAASLGGSLGGGAGKAGKAGKLGRLGRFALRNARFAGPVAAGTATYEALRSSRTWNRTWEGVGARIADATMPRVGPMPAIAGAGRAQVNVNGGLHLHGVQNVPKLEQELSKRHMGRPNRRRGAH